LREGASSARFQGAPSEMAMSDPSTLPMRGSDTLRAEAKRLACFPGERLEFRAWPAPGRGDEDIEWSGGGAPDAGPGRRFRTSFERSGSYAVRARSGDASVEFVVAVCPIDEWMAEAAAFYGPSLDLRDVRVASSRLVLGGSGTGFTCNRVIRFKRPLTEEHLPSSSTLVHELGHVWEHQDGRAQLLRGFVEQVGKRLGRDPYDYGGPSGAASTTDFRSLRLESQAQIIQELWRARHGAATDMRDHPFTASYVDDLQRLVDGAGIGTMAPRGKTVASRIDGIVAGIVNAIVDRAG
jgi:hypothetical protein